MTSTAPDRKVTHLRRMKMLATGLLAVAAALFTLSLVLPESFGTRLLHAAAEAALVGGLADWFAVVALFRRPMGLPIPHTAIIPNNKDRIADNLAEFVKTQFLGPQALTDLILKNRPADQFAAWISQPENVTRLGMHFNKGLAAWLDLVNDREVQEFLKDSYKTLATQLDASAATASILETMTSNGRHQQLLDAALTQLQESLAESDVRSTIADGLAAWFKREYSTLERFMPTETLANYVANEVASALNAYMANVANSPKHELRKRFDATLEAFISKLKSDPDYQTRAQAIKELLLTSPEAMEYVGGLWNSARTYLVKDLTSESPKALQLTQRLGRYLGEKLTKDTELTNSLNEHLAKYVAQVAPGFADFLAGHIRETIYRWEAASIAQELETSIGADLQFIRLNGTAVGAVIGVLIFLISNTIH